MLNDHSITSPHNEPQRSPGFVQKQPPFSTPVEKCVLNIFANFSGKNLCWSLFLTRKNFICERLLLFASPQNTITNSSSEFGLDETLTECKVSIFLKRTEAVAPTCSAKNVFLEISQNSQENTCARVSFLKTLQKNTSGVQSNFIQSNATKDKKKFL